MSEEREYVLGTDEAELNRLGLQHRLWADAASNQWRRARFGPGMRILDLGSGPGFATRDLCELVGAGGSVVAADLSKRFIDFVRAHPTTPGSAPIEAHCIDANDLHTVIDESSLDGVYLRWVLHFTPEPAKVIEQAARALKPGGRLAVQDYSNWQGLHWGPLNATLPILRRGILSSYEEVRADSNVGSIVPGLCERSGLRVIEITPLTRVFTPADPLWMWPDSYFRNYLPRITERGHLTPDELDAIMAEWQALGEEPGAMFFGPIQTEVIAEKM